MGTLTSMQFSLISGFNSVAVLDTVQLLFFLSAFLLRRLDNCCLGNYKAKVVAVMEVIASEEMKSCVST